MILSIGGTLARRAEDALNVRLIVNDHGIAVIQTFDVFFIYHCAFILAVRTILLLFLNVHLNYRTSKGVLLRVTLLLRALRH